jgi:hypothetical protein
MMFLKAIFALYFAAIAIAAPKVGVVDVDDLGMFRVNLCPWWTNLILI